MEQLKFDFGNVTVKEETFSYTTPAGFSVEAVISVEDIKGDIDYRLTSITVMDCKDRVVTPEDAGVCIADVVREYEISQELLTEGGVWQ
jgi:hypothetical protein